MEAVVYLANHKGNVMMLSSEIVRRENISYHYLAKILQRLPKFGYIESAKGRNGGFQITEKGLNCTVGMLIKQIDGFSTKKECAFGKILSNENNPCTLHMNWSKIRDDINKSIIELKIKDLIIKRNRIFWEESYVVKTY